MVQGWDCFGLFLYVMEKLGLDLPDFDYSGKWVSEGKNLLALHYYKFADQITKENIIQGDIVFMCTDPDHPEVANHIGVILSFGRFLHMTKEGVRVERLAGPPHCRRIDSFYRMKGLPA